MTAAPAGALTPPVAVAPVPDLVNNILGGKQYISPSYWVGWAMEKLFGLNPWGWIAEQFAGDWNAAAEASDALNKLAEFNRRYSAILDEATVALVPGQWDGQAAEQARTYFLQLATTLEQQVEALEAVAGQFRTLAAGMQEMAESLKSLCQDLGDLLIVIGISAAATAATSWTGVGAVIGGSATAVEIAQAIRLWYLVLDAHDAAWAAVQGFTGICAGYLGALHGMENHALPGTAYDHPGV
ncbi:hypothetical protein EV385_4069 [Krasilnikovia cinnamomea]|uniref:Type VII secretion system (Wss) protein ESAT-6 n=1 Tax=Krasilnikovia cinnamomea TaxID=349313 RepID=A0A4Q7ZMJ0_9ACTN|nr:hypothetical protein [Krasilnikovia cinnamomea]RZU52222.1 hypothetical protein EV385_4069 [Krasilnikovia cinnamomea]